ncbi:hypothetical protein [Natronobacterium gregoryi]|uniref:Uncharacterized protein n=2 Tax=Natronobacterium gregoryi TaxID=44930 RepID=L0AN25_NATGS|nr:hypothetical protein [Natronobacterium gregoryi]AFZ74587.1 hypothetical protein Natgr_3468 [Natronobacterium gregoryi SP2]ELY72589.1 hypothetical protein C490_03333 [Natronobacterium gregoryi SP2]PLK19777.1 hypothetical protein CYV19_12780 [Natronobacterium gregoryi SP2]SFJ29993.1 hypothetical protein SAMN05443661_1215 [Natronobacterium gregoryi]
MSIQPATTRGDRPERWSEDRIQRDLENREEAEAVAGPEGPAQTAATTRTNSTSTNNHSQQTTNP